MAGIVAFSAKTNWALRVKTPPRTLSPLAHRMGEG